MTPGGARPLLLAAAAAIAGASIAAAATPAPAAAPCVAAHLRAWAGRSGVGLGSVYATFAFVNAGADACSLSGRPRVALLDVAGRPMTTTEGTYEYGRPAARVRLASGARAHFLVVFSDGGGYSGQPGFRTCPASARLVLTPPGSSRGLILSGRRAHLAPYGRRAGECGVLLVSAVAASVP